MGLMEKLGVAVGIGIAQLTITLDDPTAKVSGGDTVRGTIKTRGGKADELGDLSVALYERWYSTVYNGRTTTTVTNYQTHNETLVAAKLELKAGEDGPEYRFILTMPFDGTLTHEWGVAALYESQEAVDSVAYAPVAIAPPAAIANLIPLIQALMPFDLYEFFNNGAEYTLNFRAASPETKGKFDSVHLKVHADRETGRVTGTFLVNPQEHTLTEHLQSLIQANNRRYDISFTDEDIAKGTEGQAFATLRSCLDKTLAKAAG